MYHPLVDSKIEFKDVKKIEVSEDGKLVAFTIHQKIKKDSLHLQIFNTSDQSVWSSTDKYTDLQKLTFNEQETSLAYLASRDTAKIKVYSLAVLNYENKTNTIIADTNSSFMPELDAVSIHYQHVVDF